MLIVFSQALSMAPSYIQIRFSAIARQQWRFKAPYSDDHYTLGEVALELALRSLWEIIALYNAGCDIPTDCFPQRVIA